MRPKNTPSPLNPSGYCMCGCGQKTSLAPQARSERGYAKGDPLKFVAGHHTRSPRSAGHAPIFLKFKNSWAIPLPHDEFALIDEVDVPTVSGYSWSKTSAGYIQGSCGTRKPTALHRLITNAPSGSIVDHINGDTLDNRRANIRLCTVSENAMNSTARTGATSRYKGVSLDRANRKWRAKIKVKGSTIHLGRYLSEIDAARAYDIAARNAFGEFAKLNFPDG